MMPLFGCSSEGCALVAELVDAADSKSVIGNDVGVRLSPRAPYFT